ncbi:site-specific integrase [Rhizobium herbae]|uniref:Site-specific integrase n=2 Tax=Rhizobium herbae TaxID=508661 RepID=A0ABS7HC09_9HYPH|nr:site-specific integrase [Rhizobium herbae]
MKTHRGNMPATPSISGMPASQPGQAAGLSSVSIDPAGAGDSARMSASHNTRRAYAGDWKHFTAWCRRHGEAALPPEAQIVSRYLAACAAGSVTGDKRPNSAATIERRLSSLSWNYVQRGERLDRKDHHITAVMAEIRNSLSKPPIQKIRVNHDDIIAMLATLDRGSLRGIRDRAILLIGFAGRLRRSEIVGLDVEKDQSDDGGGWVEIGDERLLVTLRGRTRLRTVEISRDSPDATCPVAALEMWLKFARITHGPLFRRVTGRGKLVGSQRLNGQEVARLVKRTALAAGIGELAEHDRVAQFSGRSLRPNVPSPKGTDGGGA